MPQHKSVNGLNCNNYITRERKRKLTRKSVLKMLAVMEASSQNAGPSSSSSTTDASTSTSESGINAQEFLSSGRTGRRNALPDILGQHAAVTSSDLPSRLQALTTKDKPDSSSSSKKEEPNTSKKS